MQKNTKNELALMPKEITSDSEKEFLSAQAEDAKRRFQNSAETMLRSLFEKVNVVQMTKEHPFKSTGVAAGIGFIIAQGIPNRSETPIVSEPEGKKTETPKQPSSLSALLLPIIYEASSDILKNTLLPFIQGMTQKFSPGEERVDEKEESLDSDAIV